MKKEIIPIQFKEGQYKAYNESLKQWNHSQKLSISGLDISDEIVEVHFSLQEYGGGAKRMVGTVIDGVIHVGIPVFILEGPEWSSEYYNAYAWIYLSDEESAETVRKIEFTIEARPKPDEYVTPEELTFLQQLELAIQNKLDKSGHAPNKFLGTDEQGNVVTKEQEEFNLEVANEDKLGGVKPLNKTDDMTLEVGVDKDGRLFAKGKDITVDSKLSKESKNPVQNKVLTKEVNTLKEHNTQLKETIEKLQIKVTTEKASFHNIKDSANMKVVDFGMEGKTTQDGTPTPENQVEVVNAGVYNEETGRYEHKCCVGNKNFAYNILHGLMIDEAGTILDTTYGKTYRTFKGVLPKGDYTIYLKDEKISISRTILNGSYNVINSVAINLWTFTVNDTSEVIISFKRENTVEFNGTENIQIERGVESITDYVEPQSQPFTLTSPVPLTKWDKLVKRAGVYGWSIWSIKNTITDISKYNVFGGKLGTDRCRVFITGIDNFNEGDIMSDIAFTNSTYVSIRPLGTNRLAFFCPLTYIDYVEGDSDGTVVQKFKDKVLSKEFTILYQTAEEQAFHPLPEEEQELLHNLETYYGVTNLYNDQGCPTWLTYVADPKLYLDNQLLEIKSAIV